MPPKNRIGVRGKILVAQTREIIAKVLEFMKKEAEEGVQIPVKNFKARVIAATGIGETTYRAISKQAENIKSGVENEFTTPKKNLCRPQPKRKLVVGELETIRSIIHDYCIIEKKQPTLKAIYNKVIACGIDYKGSISTLGRLIKTMGFEWKTTSYRRKILQESYEIRYKRIIYLKQLQLCIRENRPCVFADESYIHSSHCSNKTWGDNSKYDFTKPIGKGQRLIMVHAGGREGFVPHALLIFKSGSKSGDYHDDMNHTNFMNWVKNQLIPNLSANSVLVVDNASYHNVTVNKDPTTATRKPEMIKWLVERNIPHNASCTKPELYEIIKEHKGKNKQYILDTEMAKHGHRVLRLPPYHPELNPIEKIWATVKNWVAARNTEFKFAKVEELAREKFRTISREEWGRLCDHVDKIVQDYMEKEHLFDERSDEFEFVVNTGDSDDDVDDFDEDSDDDDDKENDFANQ